LGGEGKASMIGALANDVKKKRGRKAASESRSTEIRARLLIWKVTPAPKRSSLRALAAELGTSHQLLSVYLNGLNDWQKVNYRRRADAIRAHAETENRDLTLFEQSQISGLERAAFRCMMDSLLTSSLKRYESEFRRRKILKLTRHALKLFTMLAQHGFPRAQKLLEKHRINLPQGSKESR
jgi:hypothetical protein